MHTIRKATQSRAKTATKNPYFFVKFYPQTRIKPISYAGHWTKSKLLRIIFVSVWAYDLPIRYFELHYFWPAQEMHINISLQHHHQRMFVFMSVGISNSRYAVTPFLAFEENKMSAILITSKIVDYKLLACLYFISRFTLQINEICKRKFSE